MSPRPAWNPYAFGDVLDDPRLPAAIKREIRRGRALAGAGIAPRAANGPFRQMVDGAVCLNDQAAVTGSTTEQALFSVAAFAGWGPNQLRAGQKWKLTVTGLGTTPASSQGNITISPRFGTSTGGTALGASTATALAASATNVRWGLESYLTVRSVGNPGVNSKVVCSGKFYCDVGLIAASTGNVFLFGTNAAGGTSVDLGSSAGFFIGVTFGSASDSFTVLDVILESLN